MKVPRRIRSTRAAVLLTRRAAGLRMPVGQQHWIAAPTAAFLYQFWQVCIAGRDTWVAHFEQPLFARR